MNDFGLDLAIIGNGRTAALVDPASRIVWWCYPRFDGDPMFSRLLAGDEEKGFCDVVLDGMVEYTSEYVRNTAIVSTVLTDDKGAAVRITDFAPRFREYDRIYRPPQLHADHRAGRGPAANHHPDASDQQLRRPDGAQIDRQQSHELSRRRRGDPAHHRRAVVLYRSRGAFRADAAAPSRHRSGRAVPGGSVHDLPLIRCAHAGLLDRVGAAALDRL